MTEPSAAPLVDVLIPVRAPAPWLSDALQSVLAQDAECWRLLVVMDGFSQEVQDACDRLPEGTPIRVEVLPTGSGLVTALNQGLKVSAAQFIARLDADDLCHPSRIARQIEYLRRTPECVALGTGVELIDVNGIPFGTRGPRHAGSVIRELRWRCPIAHPSVTMRRASVVTIGGYSARARHAEDFDLWLRLAKLGEIHAIPDPLVQYRIHGGQVTSRLKFGDQTRRKVGTSRIALARARRESTLAARFRQACWLALNMAKGR